MEKKSKGKIKQKVILLVVCVSILLAYLTVSCSASGWQEANPPSSLDYPDNHCIGLPADLFVWGAYTDWYREASVTQGFLGLPYSEGSPFDGFVQSDNFWPGGIYGYWPDYNYRRVTSGYNELSSDNQYAWYDGTVSYTVSTIAMSTQYAESLEYAMDNGDNLDDQRILFVNMFKEIVSTERGLNDPTLNVFGDFMLQFKGGFKYYDALINPKFSFEDIFPNDAYLTFYVDSSCSSYQWGSNYGFVYSDDVDYADISFTVGGYIYLKDPSSNVVSDAIYFNHTVVIPYEEGLASPMRGDSSTIVGAYTDLLNNESNGTDIGVGLMRYRFQPDAMFYYAMDDYLSRYPDDYEFYIENPTISFDVVYDSSTNMFDNEYIENYVEGVVARGVPKYQLILRADNVGDVMDIVNDKSFFTEGVSNDINISDFKQFGLWLGDIISGVFTTPLIADITLAHILYVAIGCGFVLLVLKFFAGG